MRLFFVIFFYISSVYAAEDIFSNDPLSDQLGLNGSQAECNFLEVNPIADLLHSHLSEQSSLSLHDMRQHLLQLPCDQRHHLFAQVARRDKKEMGARAQLMLFLMENMKKMSDGEMQQMNDALSQKDKILSQKNFENWASIVVVGIFTSLLTYLFGANC